MLKSQIISDKINLSMGLSEGLQNEKEKDIKRKLYSKSGHKEE